LNTRLQSRFSVSLRASLRLAGFALLTALGLASVRAATPITFTLDDSYATSAGIFKTDGTLIRTLWSNVRHPAGPHTFTWDDQDDAGVTVPAGTYGAKVVYHNINYTWEGTIGNTSSSFTGYTRRGFIMITDMATDGKDLYSAMGYNENQPGVQRSTLTDPQTASYSVPKCITATFYHVATDGVRYYLPSTGQGVDFGRRHSFVYARKVSDNSVATFEHGEPVCLQKKSGGDCYPEHTFPSCIDVEAGVKNPPSGIAVQKTGNVLAVSHRKLGEVRLFDKTSGKALGALRVPAPNRLAFAPNGDLWVVSGSTVQRFAATTLGTAAAPVTTLDGLVAPQAVSVNPADNDLVLVADGGASQQVKAFTRTGSPLWTHGTAGGYSDGDPVVTPSKLSFAEGRTFVTAMADGSFWVSDTGNDRVLHFSASRAYLEQIQYLPAFYIATCDPNEPSRVIGDSWLEFAVDYSKPLLPGDPTAPGGNRSWQLVKNWGHGAPADYKGKNGFIGLHTVVTLKNGRTYGVLRNLATRQQDLVELPAKGPLRVTGITLPSGANLYANGDLRMSSKKASVQTVIARSLTGFDDAGNPLWGEPVVLATTTGSANYSGSFSGPSGPRYPITSSHILVSFNSDVKSKGMHLGGVPVGGSAWKWLASPSSVSVDYAKPSGKTGQFATDGGTNYGGNQVHASGRNIVYGYHGEGYRGGQANQFMHFRDDGLFLGQFGEVNRPSIMDARPGVSGNAFSLSLVEVKGELYFWNNDESNHGGVHRWHLAGANRVGELSATGSLGKLLSLGRSSKPAASSLSAQSASK